MFHTPFIWGLIYGKSSLKLTICSTALAKVALYKNRKDIFSVYVVIRFLK